MNPEWNLQSSAFTAVTLSQNQITGGVRYGPRHLLVPGGLHHRIRPGAGADLVPRLERPRRGHGAHAHPPALKPPRRACYGRRRVLGQARPLLRRHPLRGLAAPAQRAVDPGRGGAGARRCSTRSRCASPRAGRTDAGVHALGQVASFAVERAAAGAGLREGDERPPAGGHRGARGRGPRGRPSTRGATPGASATATGSRTLPTRAAAARGCRPGRSSGRSTSPPCAPPPRRSSAGTTSAPSGPPTATPHHAVRELRRLEVLGEGRGAHRGGGRGHRLPEAHGAQHRGDARRGRAGRRGAPASMADLLREPRPDAGRAGPRRRRGWCSSEVFYDE